MKLSKLFIKNTKDVPAEVKSPSHKLLLKGSYIRKISPGLYSYLPAGCLILKKIRAILERELEKSGFQEIIMPLLLPQELIESGFSEDLERDRFIIRDSHKRDYMLSINYGETITGLVGKEVRNYKELPLYFYHTERGFRDEYKPKGGLIKAREFFMNNAWSFHSSPENLEKSYRETLELYNRIFKQLCLDVKVIDSDTAGCPSHKFLILNDYGYEAVIVCSHCCYEKSPEKVEIFIPPGEIPEDEIPPAETVLTPGKTTIEEVTEFMGEKASSFIKTIIYKADGKPAVALVRGDREINNHKLRHLLGVRELELADEKLVETVSGAPVGFAGPAGLQGVPVVADVEVKYMKSAIAGANRADMHLKNLKAGRDFHVQEYGDIRMVSQGDLCRDCKNPLEIKNAILLAHMIKAEDKFSKKMKATFCNEDGEEKEFLTGYYGFFISPSISAIIEQNSDEKGIIWPVTVAPFSAVILLLNPQDEKQRGIAFHIYEKLKEQNIDVLIDDRDIKVGAKFKEADLMGIPLRITTGSRTVKDGSAEGSVRKTGEKFKIYTRQSRIYVLSLF